MDTIKSGVLGETFSNFLATKYSLTLTSVAKQQNVFLLIDLFGELFSKCSIRAVMLRLLPDNNHPLNQTRSVTTHNKHTSLFVRNIAVNFLATGSLWLVLSLLGHCILHRKAVAQDSLGCSRQ